VEVFYVAPPSLDEIKRYVRDMKSSAPQAPKKEEKPAAKKPAAKKTTTKSQQINKPVINS
jgi:Sec-independent protein translocase protein TatA